MSIHSTSIIEKGSVLGNNVEVGPYSVIGSKVVIKDNVKVHSHVSIQGNTTIDEGTEIFPFASLGGRPQDLKYKGEETKLLIGKNNSIREYVTMHPGTAGDKGQTIIGDNNLFMIGVHVAHDCVLGNNIVLANNATLAGHVHIGDNVILGGMTAYLQFIKIGNNAIIGGGSIVVKDVMPYAAVNGDRAVMTGLNLIGLKRLGLKSDCINEMRIAYKGLFNTKEGTIKERAAKLSNQYKNNSFILEMIKFIINSEKAICLPEGNK